MSVQPAFQQAWYLKLNDPSHGRALWLRFTALQSKNGFSRLAETWAVYSQKEGGAENSKLGVKQTHDFSALKSSGDNGVQIADCVLSPTATKGAISAKGRTIEWDLTMHSNRPATFNLVPDFVTKSRAMNVTARSLAEDLVISGRVTLDGKTELRFENAPGMLAYHSGSKSSDSWVWGQCNAFVDEKGDPADFIFEGITAKARFAPWLSSPKVSTFYFRYRGKEYPFRSMLDLLRTRSESSLTEWNFQADRGELSFRGEVRAEHRDFAGLVYEDTDGSLLYCANSKLSAMKMHVYRRGKLEATFTSPGTAAFEVVSRKKNPYVPMIL